MNRRFQNKPITVVLGSRPKVGPDPKHQGDPERARIVELSGAPEPLKTAAGRYVGSRIIRSVPLFEGGKVVGVITAWVNAAAKRRAGGDLTKAKPSDVVLVPLFRGVAAELLTDLKANRRRDIRREQARLAAQGAIERSEQYARLVAQADGSVA